MGKNKEIKIKWYYDACTLDEKFFGRLIQDLTGKCPRKGIISHLALGEAYGNIFEEGDEKVKAFLGLIESLRKFIVIVGNDVEDELIRKLQSEVSSRVGITDIIHLATAIENKCSNIFSIDGDLTNIEKRNKDRIKNYASSNYGIKDFCITKMTS